MAESPDSMRVFDNRLATFSKADHPAKKHQSSHGKSVPKQWPHETPRPAEACIAMLASAGFYFEPISRSTDNAKCFLCKVNLGGWEIDDDPLKEHLAHSGSCSWAIAKSVTLGDEDRDPMSEKLFEARLKTFENWPHEGKRGWKPKAKKLAESGWCMDTGIDADDGVTCFYCDLALDGWAQKDDPMTEHRKRRPECAFFELLDRHAGTRPKKSRARTSTASKASRLSTQSIQSTFSEAPSLMSLGDAVSAMEGDTSIGTVTSTTSTTKGRKKAAAGKGRGKKKAAQELSPDATELNTALTHLEDSVVPSQSLLQSTQEDPETVSTLEESQPAAKPVPAKKATRGKAKGKKAAAQEIPVEEDDQSQLQTELAASVLEIAPAKPAGRPKRGKKRTSDGEEKIEEPASQVVEETAPQKPTRGKPGAKGKKTKAAAADDTMENLEGSVMPSVMETEQVAPEVTEDVAKPKKGRKPKATKKAKSPSPVSEPEPEEDLVPEPAVADEVEVEDHDGEDNYVVHPDEEGSEANYVVHDDSSANFIVHDHTATIDEEMEPSPTPHKAAPQPPPPKDDIAVEEAPASAQSTPRSIRSTQSSDAENHPPSSKTKKRASATLPSAAPSPPRPATAIAAPPLLSPTKTTRVPLAAQTPNRSPHRSPTKLGLLKTSTPWTAIDIETIFASTDIAMSDQENVGVAGDAAAKRKMAELNSPEKKMTVEEWVRFQATKGEVRLREECERVVWLFEREGRRAMGVLQGVQVAD